MRLLFAVLVCAACEAPAEPDHSILTPPAPIVVAKVVLRSPPPVLPVVEAADDVEVDVDVDVEADVPDVDDDGEGVPDVEDRCPDEPEDREGIDDDDGCPEIANPPEG